MSLSRVNNTSNGYLGRAMHQLDNWVSSRAKHFAKHIMSEMTMQHIEIKEPHDYGNWGVFFIANGLHGRLRDLKYLPPYLVYRVRDDNFIGPALIVGHYKWKPEDDDDVILDMRPHFPKVLSSPRTSYVKLNQVRWEEEEEEPLQMSNRGFKRYVTAFSAAAVVGYLAASLLIPWGCI